MISAGVPTGANSPFHDVTSYPATPASATVGTSAKNGERWVPDVATARILLSSSVDLIGA